VALLEHRAAVSTGIGAAVDEPVGMSDEVEVMFDASMVWPCRRGAYVEQCVGVVQAQAGGWFTQ
jgi:hypothetical protein